ncbi:MAG: hydrogenase assembly protein HypC [Thermodesulfovibrio sp. RBG_19FT_COMBO_42_12]|nr:MAG: hydrogenase assembly protein HypC [Thermodesulfovibrio sp. RBG_19FT_COMBO_42_12]
MCLAVPSKIIRVKNATATIDVYGAQRDISLLLLEDEVNIGDYVLVHAGFAIQKIQKDIAEETLGLFKKIFELDNIDNIPASLEDVKE